MLILNADCIEAMASMPEASVDAIVTDPPYGLEFMGKDWDRCDARQPFRGEIQTPDNPFGRTPVRYGGTDAYGSDRDAVHRQQQDWHLAWATEAFRVLKPGGHLVAFGGTRTYHRLACAIEDAGFEIRDSLHWLYGSGFPKSKRVNSDPRFCSCAEPARSGASTSPEPGQGDRTDTAAGADGGAPLIADAPRSSRRRGGSPADCQPDRGCDDGLAPLAPGDDPASPRRSGCAPTRSRSRGRADGQDDGQGRSPSPAPHSDLPSSQGWIPLADDASAERVRKPANTSPAASDGSAGRTLDTDQGQAYGSGLPRCSTCGKPMADGLHTALKPAHEPIVLARKPLDGTVAANVLEHGTGAINVDACRLQALELDPEKRNALPAGRWPPNVLLTHSEDCVCVGMRKVRGQNGGGMNRDGAGGNVVYGRHSGHAKVESVGYADADGTETVPTYNCAPGCPIAELDRQSGDVRSAGLYPSASETRDGVTDFGGRQGQLYGDTGGASRFFPTFRYVAKPSRGERDAGLHDLTAASGGEATDRKDGSDGLKSPRAGAGRNGGSRNVHPTVKPVELMEWLVTLVTPPGGTVLDPFMGSGSTGCAAVRLGFDFVGIEREKEYVEIAQRRIKLAKNAPRTKGLGELERAEPADPRQIGLFG